jgi:hypothetical protein
MTILEMFEREDIYGILETTMRHYYKEVYHKDIEVSITKSHFGKRLLIYPRLGIVVSRFPSWAVIRRTYVSFDVQGNLPKKLFAWAYITLCFLTFGLLADASIKLSDYSAWARGTILIPSNRKLRIYRYDKGYVDSILKDGFNDYYFNKELEVRRNPQFDFILGLLDSGNRWYREVLLKGRCLVRVSPNKYGIYLKRVLADLSAFYERNTEAVVAGQYVCQLADEYEDKLQKVIEQKHIKCGDKVGKVIERVKESFRESRAQIPITLTHGDLQTGNVYLDEETDKIYIIDWETVKKKSIWYDSVTIFCETRRKDKFSGMINARFDAEVKKDVLYYDTDKARDMNLVAGILLLEELGFFLDEIIDLPGEMGVEIIERYEYEIDHIDWTTF